MIDDKRLTNIALKPNITERENAWNLVPGDIVERWNPNHLTAHSREATDLQNEEKMYYKPCALCGRHEGRIKREGPVQTCRDHNCPEIHNI